MMQMIQPQDLHWQSVASRLLPPRPRRRTTRLEAVAEERRPPASPAGPGGVADPEAAVLDRSEVRGAVAAQLAAVVVGHLRQGLAEVDDLRAVEQREVGGGRAHEPGGPLREGDPGEVRPLRAGAAVPVADRPR